MTLSAAYKKLIERSVGLPFSQMQKNTLDENTRHIEQMTGKKHTSCSEFPYVGRGSVLRDIVTHDEIENDIDAILRKG